MCQALNMELFRCLIVFLARKMLERHHDTFFDICIRMKFMIHKICGNAIP